MVLSVICLMCEGNSWNRDSIFQNWGQIIWLLVYVKEITKRDSSFFSFYFRVVHLFLGMLYYYSCLFWIPNRLCKKADVASLFGLPLIKDSINKF